MSREIKFRAWDFKSMRYDVTGLEYGKANETAGVSLGGDYHAISNEPGDEYNKTASLMQFTGLHDINGVEIYEGDIISDHAGTGVVKYAESFGAFRVSYGDGYAKWFYDYLKSEFRYVRVIGNIHQTKKLLGQK